jgi:hypothetical protein
MQMAIVARATRYLSTEWMIPITIREWEQERATHHYVRATGEHRISYSQEGVMRIFDRGYIEYPSLQNKVPDCNGKGWYGMWLIITHEFAHALQYSYPNGRPEGSSHNEAFVDALRRIRNQWQYQSFCLQYNINQPMQTMTYTKTPRRQHYITAPKPQVMRSASAPLTVQGRTMVTIANAAAAVGVRYQQVYQLVQKGKIDKEGDFVNLRQVQLWAENRTRR